MLFSDDDLHALIEPFSTRCQCLAYADTGDEFKFTAIFDQHHKQFAGDAFSNWSGDIDLSGSSPELVCVSSDVSQLVQAEGVIVNGEKWQVRDMRPDGTGITRIELKR